jgi:hypothetical protein
VRTYSILTYVLRCAVGSRGRVHILRTHTWSGCLSGWWCSRSSRGSDSTAVGMTVCTTVAAQPLALGSRLCVTLLLHALKCTACGVSGVIAGASRVLTVGGACRGEHAHTCGCSRHMGLRCKQLKAV